MKVTEKNFDEQTPSDGFLPHLFGKVFHITHYSKWEAIQRSQKLLANEGSFTGSFNGPPDAFFRSMGHISFFDLRKTKKLSELKDLQMQCSPLMPLGVPPNKIVIFILKEEAHQQLIDSSACKNEFPRLIRGYEVGYPKEVPFSLIEEAIIVSDPSQDNEKQNEKHNQRMRDASNKSYQNNPAFRERIDARSKKQQALNKEVT